MLVRPYKTQHWVEQRAVGKGAKAGWKAGRRLESLPHIGHDMEGTEKANHRGHGGHGEKQTTENTEIGREGRRVEVERTDVRAGWRGDSRAARDCVALPA